MARKCKYWLSSYGLLNTKYAECKQQNVELVQIRDLLRRELEGIKEKKKGLLEIAQNGNERTALSSYAVLQTKYAVSSKEKIDLIQMIGKLRGELEDFNRNEEEDISYNKAIKVLFRLSSTYERNLMI